MMSISDATRGRWTSHREPDPGVARGRLDDRAAGGEPPLSLGFIDHGDADPVLDAPAGVERLDLDPDARRHPLGQAPERDQWRLADVTQETL